MKSLKRLSIDPLAVYGTLCVSARSATPRWPTWRASRGVDEIAIVQPE